MTEVQDPPSLAADLKEARIALGLSRATIAHHMQCSVDTIARIEKGKGTPGHRKMYAITLRDKAPNPTLMERFPAILTEAQR